MTETEQDEWSWGQTGMLLRLRPPATPSAEQRAVVARALALVTQMGLRFEAAVYWRYGADGICAGCASRDERGRLELYLDTRLEGPSLAATFAHEAKHLDDFRRGLAVEDRAGWEARAIAFSEGMMLRW